MRTSKKKKKNTLKIKFYFFVSISALILLLSMDMYQKFKIDLIMKDLHQLEERKKQLMSETELLRSQVDRLKNIDRISKIAKEKLNLINNTDEAAVIQIDDLDKVDDLKVKFANRRSKEQKYNLAGVQ
jgi:cell division protein FtsL